MVSGTRIIGIVLSVETQLECAEVQFEDYNHVYMCAVGKLWYIKYYLYLYCILNPFLELYEGKKVATANALYCYDNQYGQYYIICVNWGLYFKDEELEIMSTFRARASGAVVSNIPKQFE